MRGARVGNDACVYAARVKLATDVVCRTRTIAFFPHQPPAAASGQVKAVFTGRPRACVLRSLPLPDIR